MYDGYGELVGFKNNEGTFYYLKNQQGDIMQVVNASGEVETQYSYDAWGKFTSSYVNPFTYRGYYFDSETGLYYLNSRYYDPETCRFISSDAYVDTGQGIYAHNMFAYCNNNPVDSIDSDGDSSTAVTLTLAAFDGLIAGACTLISGGTLVDAAINAGGTFFSSYLKNDFLKICLSIGVKLWNSRDSFIEDDGRINIENAILTTGFKVSEVIVETIIQDDYIYTMRQLSNVFDKNGASIMFSIGKNTVDTVNATGKAIKNAEKKADTSNPANPKSNNAQANIISVISGHWCKYC